MNMISFGWSWPAFVARQKTITRRDWKPRHAAKFQPGVPFVAFDHDLRYGGKPIGEGKIISVRRELLATMPDSDYEAEGFHYLLEHPELVPPPARKRPWGDCTRESFLAWRRDRGQLESFDVVRFETTRVLKSAERRIERILNEARLLSSEL